MSRRKEWIGFLAGTSGAFLGLFGVTLFNQAVLLTLPLWVRMVSMIVSYWLIAFIPVLILVLDKEDSFTNYGFAQDRIGRQITIGIFIGLAMSFLLTVAPHIFGFGEYVDSGKRYRFLWQFTFEFVYCIVAVGFVEEFVFRGFIYGKIKEISQKDTVAVIGSSVLFGAFHLFGGHIVQMLMTACIGAFFCFCRLKIKNCSVLSLIIAHGIYDALISVWASIFMQYWHT